MREVWKKIRKLSGKFIPSPQPTLKINDTIISEPSEVAEKLGKHFSGISSPRNYSPEFQKIRQSQAGKLIYYIGRGFLSGPGRRTIPHDQGSGEARFGKNSEVNGSIFICRGDTSFYDTF